MLKIFMLKMFLEILFLSSCHHEKVNIFLNNIKENLYLFKLINVNVIFLHDKAILIIPNFARSCYLPESSTTAIIHNTGRHIQDVIHQPIQFSWILIFQFNLI